MSATSGTSEIPTSLRAKLREGQQHIQQRFEATGRPDLVLQGRTRLVDDALIQAWQHSGLPESLTLIAVGGYGRKELYPCSDIDIMVLLADKADQALCEQIQAFISLLWDIGLEIGHSVRTLEECRLEARADLTVQTNLLEARYLTGNRPLYQSFTTQYTQRLNPEAFFYAKRAEQEQRYNRFEQTPYALEPHCKESPGGLRDLHTLVWVCLAAGLGNTWPQMQKNGLVREEGARDLARAQHFMRQMRIRLHYIARRREDRVIFDHQEALAQAFGCAATKTRRASEVLMQRYYRAAKTISQLNSILLRNLAIRYQPYANPPAKALNERFQIQGSLLDLVSDDIFEQHPSALLEAFLLVQTHPELTAMSVRTERALWRGQRLINAAFRKEPRHRALFMQIVMAEGGQTHAFRHMNHFGVLGAYLPAFGRIVGQMQHDLFHVYTVDQHTLQVLRNIRRFAAAEHGHEYPLLTELFSAFERPWVLYLASLFHDIAKGRGGDHSQLGKADTRRFCRQHGIAKEDTQLIIWLVEHHLTMSQVAQKQDLADPKVIERFTKLVKTERRLAALYLLTHSDIRGTSPKVWTNWKARLLEDLYTITSKILRGDTPEQAQGLAERQEQAREKLRFFGLSPQIENELWAELDTVYFMRHGSDEVAWHTRNLYYRPHSAQPVVKARSSKVEKGLQVMVYTPDRPALFAQLCAFFNRLGFSILDAKIHTTRHGYALDSFMVINPQGQEDYRDMISLVEHELTEKLTQNAPITPPATGRISRHIKHFPITPVINLQPDESGQRYILSLIAADRPGLLLLIAHTLAQHNITVHTAKIATLGERVEDTFLVSLPPSQDTDQRAAQLEANLLEKLRT